MTDTYRDWQLSLVLHASQTSIYTSTEATPYSLAYDKELVLPIEVEIPS